MNNPKQPQTFVLGGRMGDLIFMLPAFKYIGEQTGLRPNVICATQFADVLDGVTYVKALPKTFHWTQDLCTVILRALMDYDNVTIVQLHGHNWHVKGDSLKSYSLSMWERVGLLDKYAELPLVFDNRNVAREFALFKGVQQLTGHKPMLLLSLVGMTSRFGYPDDLLRAIDPFRKRFNFVTTHDFQAQRIYDYLGLMDKAVGMITIDTSMLHLAAASSVPYIALTRDDGQAGSIPKGNCVLQVGYSETMKRMDEIVKAVEGFGKKKP